MRKRLHISHGQGHILSDKAVPCTLSQASASEGVAPGESSLTLHCYTVSAPADDSQGSHLGDSSMRLPTADVRFCELRGVISVGMAAPSS